MNRIWTAIGLLTIFHLAGCGEGLGPGVPPGPGPSASGSSRPRALTGEQVYVDNCAICHGTTGQGDGRAAEFLFPRPRNFTSGWFKLRTNRPGELPTDEDLLRTVTRGIPGSAMPSFAHLPEADRRSVIQYVKTFASIDIDGEMTNLFDLRPPGPSIEVGDPPPNTPEIVARGRGVYQRAGCASCHGESGRGDGPSSPTLRDNWETPIRPANFTRGIFKGGADPAEIFVRFTTGMTGTPMPSFESTIPDPADRWALAYYVLSLRTTTRTVEYTSGGTVPARRVPSVGEPDPMSPMWDSIEPTEIALMSAWQRTEAADWLTIRAVHDGHRVAMMLEWDDPTADVSTLGMAQFTDAVAAEFALTDPPGSFAMGDADHPVNIWQWRMDRQMDLAQFQDVEMTRTGMQVDQYPFEHGRVLHDPNVFPVPDGIPSAPSHDPTYLTGHAAGNPFSDPYRRTACLSLTARGFGTLETLAPERQTVVGRGVYLGGRWRAVQVRDFRAGEGEVAFAAGRTVPVAFAVWDGSHRDRDGMKAITYWQNLALER